MTTFSDEPVLVKTKAGRRDWRRWVVGALALTISGLFVYVPIEKHRLAEAAHYAPRGERQGVKVEFVADNTPHSLELTWLRGRFTPILTPPPPEGATLELSGRFGSDTLTWNAELGAFGPGSHDVDPYDHYKLKLALKVGEKVWWRDTVWAYGIHDTHGHSH